MDQIMATTSEAATVLANLQLHDWWHLQTFAKRKTIEIIIRWLCSHYLGCLFLVQDICHLISCVCHCHWNAILTSLGSIFGFIFGTHFWYPCLIPLLDMHVLSQYFEDYIFAFIFGTHFRYPFWGSFLVPIFDLIYSWILQFIYNFVFVIDSYFRKTNNYRIIISLSSILIKKIYPIPDDSKILGINLVP